MDLVRWSIDKNSAYRHSPRFCPHPPSKRSAFPVSRPRALSNRRRIALRRLCARRLSYCCPPCVFFPMIAHKGGVFHTELAKRYSARPLLTGRRCLPAFLRSSYRPHGELKRVCGEKSPRLFLTWAFSAELFWGKRWPRLMPLSCCPYLLQYQKCAREHRLKIGIFSDSSGFLLKAKKASIKSFSECRGCMN